MVISVPMAWNTEETRRRLKAAAVEEFAEHGLAGARVDRIAARSGVNKERLYGYFGNKERLFATVLRDELARAAAAVPMELRRPEDIGEFAGRVFDYHTVHPHLARLLHWEALAYGDRPVPDEEVRGAYYREKVEAFAAAQADGMLAEDSDAAHLVFLILALAGWWFAVPQVVRMLAGPGSDPAQDRARQRTAVVEATRRLMLPPTPAPSRAAPGGDPSLTGAESQRVQPDTMIYNTEHNAKVITQS